MDAAGRGAARRADVTAAPEPPPLPAPPAAPTPQDALIRRLARWLPFAMAGHLVVGVPALLISLVVAWGTYVQARATQRMQQAAAWPFVAFDSSNHTPEGRRRISLSFSNEGVGPALLGPVEISYRGHPVRSPEALLAACCGYDPARDVRITLNPVSNVVLRPGARVSFFDLPDVPQNYPLVDRLDRERWALRVRSCYCSIFSDCWTIDGAKAVPQPVPRCPADWALYNER